MKKLIASILIASVSIPALAWGDREQGALAGLIGALLISNAMKEREYNPPVIIQPNVIIQPHPYPIQRPVCQWVVEPRSDMYGNIYYVQRRYCF